MSGIPFTILRNGWYTENYTASVPDALAGGAFLGGAGNGKISSSQGALFDDGRQLSALIGRPTTPLATAVADALKQAK